MRTVGKTETKAKTIVRLKKITEINLETWKQNHKFMRIFVLLDA